MRRSLLVLRPSKDGRGFRADFGGQRGAPTPVYPLVHQGGVTKLDGKRRRKTGRLYSAAALVLALLGSFSPLSAFAASRPGVPACIEECQKKQDAMLKDCTAIAESQKQMACIDRAASTALICFTGCKPAAHSLSGNRFRSEACDFVRDRGRRSEPPEAASLAAEDGERRGRRARSESHAAVGKGFRIGC